MLSILALKSHLGHERLNAKVERMIKTNKQRHFLQSGHHSHPIENPIEQKLPTRTWRDQIGNTLQYRKAIMMSNDFKECSTTKNKTIMGHAVECARCQDLKMSVLVPTDHARTLKRICSPCQLTRLNGREHAKEHRNANDKSDIFGILNLTRFQLLPRNQRACGKTSHNGLAIKM